MNDSNSTLQPGLSFQAVSFVRNRNEILHTVSFEAPPGEITVLFGPSGAGKTSCLRLIAGLENPGEGEIYFGNETVTSAGNFTPPRLRQVGFCFQDDALWPAVTVRDHLAVVIQSQYRDRVWIEMRTQELLDRFGLSPLAQRLPAHLSGGERKRLALARALAAQPSVLLLDEPLSSLDGPARDELISYLKTCRHEERTVILVTHQLDEAFALGERLVILADGRVLQQGPLREVLLSPRNRQTAQLLGYRNFFMVHAKKGCVHSPFGPLDIDTNGRGKALAASFVQDFEITQDSSGEGIIETIYPEMRHFRLLVRYKNETYEGLAGESIAPGQRVMVRVKHPPTLCKDE